MPRVNHVKSAKALYHTKPALDENGEPRVSPVFQRDGVTPKVDKRGNQLTRRVTVRDLDRPKPPLQCDFPGCGAPDILPGQAYKFISLRFGQRNRHAEHPDWHRWEYSSSVAAEVARLQHDMHGEIDSWEPESGDDFDALRDSLAEQARAFADEREEAVSNMPEALQDGSVAQEYAEYADQWADDIESAEAPGEAGHPDCEVCDGTGEVENPDYDPDVDDPMDGEHEEHIDCEECDGTGEVEDVLDEDWVESARDALREAVDGAQF